MAVAAHEPVLDEIADVAGLYTEQSAKVNRLVRSGVRAPEPLIEDACQVAWSRLIDHRHRIRRDTAVAWLVTTALHEALKLIRRERRDTSLEALLDEAGDLPRAMTVASADELVEFRVRLASLAALNERQRRLVWLQAIGLSYAEMAGETGATERTVERQLSRARRKLGDAT